MYSLDITVIVIIGLTVFISFKGFKDYSFLNKYLFQVSKIQQGDKIRLLSSGFLHVDKEHLLFNMITLYFFANGIINPNFLPDPNGRLNFVLIYFGSLIAGSLLGLYFHRKELEYSAVGASGAVTGILYAAIMLNPGMTLYALPAWIFGIAYMFYSIYGMKNKVGNIGHSAHLGGAIGGYILALLLKPDILTTNKITVIALSIPIILLFIFKDKIKVH